MFHFNRPRTFYRHTIAAAIALAFGSGAAMAADPSAIQRGRLLFTQPFTPTALSPGGDGLGPLFNHVSCVACHHSGGVGGGGDNRFNSRAFAIDQIRFSSRNGEQNVTAALASLNPLLAPSESRMANTLILHRYGGSEAYSQFRDGLIKPFNADWESTEIASDTVRRESGEKEFTDSTNTLRITAHIQARNTTSLFGAGLIDSVPDSVILQYAKSKKRFPEIKGRPSTLAHGRIGKFGWRANFATLLEFNENACVNELGLQSKNVPQAADITVPAYKNTVADISDDNIRFMTQFVASLPAPTRATPVDPQHAQQIAWGENRFNAVGCAQCHVRDLGPAKGIYSDLLLHDMGPKLYDYNAAQPYRQDCVHDYEIVSYFRTTDLYYGTPQQLVFDEKSREFHRDFRKEPTGSADQYINDPLLLGQEDDFVMVAGPATFQGTVIPARQTAQLRRVARYKITPTRTSMEWRTPPLWGVNDSAPYMHDGRAETILEAISMHDGEAMATRNRFLSLSYSDQKALIAFLESLEAPAHGVIPAPKDFEAIDLVSQ